MKKFFGLLLIGMIFVSYGYCAMNMNPAGVIPTETPPLIDKKQAELEEKQAELEKKQKEIEERQKELEKKQAEMRIEAEKKAKIEAEKKELEKKEKEKKEEQEKLLRRANMQDWEIAREELGEEKAKILERVAPIIKKKNDPRIKIVLKGLLNSNKEETRNVGRYLLYLLEK